MGLGRTLRSAAESITWDGMQFNSSDFVGLGSVNRAGITVNRPEIEGLSAVYRAINFLCNTQALLEIDAFKRSDRTEVRSMLLETPSPNGQFTCAEWRNFELQSRLVYGNSYAMKSGMTAASPWPSFLHPIHPSRVIPYGVYRHGVLAYTEYLIQPSTGLTSPPPGFAGALDAVDNGAVLVDRTQLFHVPGQGFDGVQGYSPIDICAQSLATAYATELAAGKFFGKGQLLSGFLKTANKLDEKQAKALKLRWQQKMSGIDNAYEVAVIDNGLEFQPLSVTPEQSQFIQMRQFNVEEIARIFGVPPFLLMSESKSHSFGTGLEQQLTATDIFTLSYWFKILEDRITLELLPNTQYAAFDKTPLVRSDVKTRWASYAIARANQLMSINEVRQIEGLPVITDNADADDPMLEPPKQAPASAPGGNDGTQGGGSESAPDVTP